MEVAFLRVSHSHLCLATVVAGMYFLAALWVGRGIEGLGGIGGEVGCLGYRPGLELEPARAQAYWDTATSGAVLDGTGI